MKINYDQKNRRSKDGFKSSEKGRRRNQREVENMIDAKYNSFPALLFSKYYFVLLAINYATFLIIQTNVLIRL